MDAPPLPETEPGETTERLWTPWRMRYVGGVTREAGCVFCNRLASDDDVASLILWRGPHAFLIMNLFPYNTGHVMLVPNEHVASPETADPGGLTEMAARLPGVLRALRRTLGCDGFNIGLNVGAVAGAGIAAHLHQHVVPRWTGDANFMPILASTMVLPELIPVTYAKLRAEMERELGGVEAVAVLWLDADGERVATLPDGRTPTVPAYAAQPLWKSVLDRSEPGPAEILGWAEVRSEAGRRGGLVVRVAAEAPPGTIWRACERAEDLLVGAAAALATPE